MGLSRHHRLLLALGLAVLLIAKPISVRGEEEEEEDDDERPADDEEKDVVVVTDKNWDDTVGKSKYALVEFYAPWCGHCKALKPNYAKAATILKGHDASIVDATEEKELGKKFEVQGYPTLKWFVDGKLAMDFSGGRQADDIVRWVKKKAGPPTVAVDSAEALEKATKDSRVYVLGFFESFEGDKHTQYEAVAKKSDDAAFVKTADKEVAAKLGLKAPGFALARNYPEFGLETVRAALDGEDEFEKQLLDFVKAERLPAFLEFSSASSNDIFGSGVAHQIIVVAKPDEFKAGSDLVTAMTAAAKELKGKVIFVYSKLGSDDSKPIMSFFGLEEEAEKPQVVGFFTKGGKKYRFDGDATAEPLKEFARKVVDGTAPKFFKSAAEPKEPKEKGVTVVVGNTVESIVKDPKKDVLLEVDSVVIAKMDGTENEHPDVEAQGFPTLLFFPAEDGAAAVPYDGERDLAGFTKFLKKNAKVPFELPKKKTKKGDKKAAKKEEEAHDEL
eukprot:scaffold1.g5246.t1